jgi:hypothetical protein
MAWHDSEADFFRALENKEITLREVDGYFTRRDQQTNAQAGTFRGMSREYSILQNGWGSTGYLLHTHQDGSWLSAAHVKDSSFGTIRFSFSELSKLDRFI